VQTSRAEAVDATKVWFRVSGGGDVDGVYVYDRESQHGPVYRNESNRKWKLGKGALKKGRAKRASHSLDDDSDAPAIFDNQARPPATGWYLYNIQGWTVAFKYPEVVTEGFEVDRRPERMKLWPPPSGEDLRPRRTSGAPSTKPSLRYLDERWQIHGPPKRGSRQRGGDSAASDNVRSDTLRVELMHGDVVLAPADPPHGHGFAPENLAQHVGVQSTVEGAPRNSMPPAADAVAGGSGAAVAPDGGSLGAIAEGAAEEVEAAWKTDNGDFGGEGEPAVLPATREPSAWDEPGAAAGAAAPRGILGSTTTMWAQPSAGRPLPRARPPAAGTLVEALRTTDVDTLLAQVDAELEADSGQDSRFATFGLDDVLGLDEGQSRRQGAAVSARPAAVPSGEASELDYTRFMSDLAQQAVRLGTTNDAALRTLFERRIHDEVNGPGSGSTLRSDGSVRPPMDEATLRRRVAAMASDLGVSMTGHPKSESESGGEGGAGGTNVAETAHAPDLGSQAPALATLQWAEAVSGESAASPGPLPGMADVASVATAGPTSTAGSNRGLCIVMQHGTRLVDVVPLSEISTEAWPDKATRPHDPPLAADGAVAASVKELTQWLGPRRAISALVCSPFRAALQTAAEAASALGLRKITVDNRIGESPRAMLVDFHAASVPPHRQTALQYVTQAVAQSIVGPTVELRWERDADGYTFADDVAERVAAAVTEAVSAASAGNVLVITHSDALRQYAPAYLGDMARFRAQPAGWIALAGPHGVRARPGAVLQVHRCADLGALPRPDLG